MNEREIARAIKTSAPMMHVLCSEPLGVRIGRGNGASKAVETLLLEADAIAARAIARPGVRARNLVLAVISRGMRRIGAVLSGWK